MHIQFPARGGEERRIGGRSEGIRVLLASDFREVPSMRCPIKDEIVLSMLHYEPE